MLKNLHHITLIIIGLLFLFSCSDDETVKPGYLKDGKYEGEYFPTEKWRECSPEEVGMNSNKLKAVYDYCADDERVTYSFMIIKDGYVVAEDYFRNKDKNSLLNSYSLAKSFTAALTGIAIQQGYLNGVEDKMVDYFSELQGEEVDPLKKEIEIKHLLTMTAGSEWEENELSSGTNDLYNIRFSTNYVQYVLNKPMVDTPGTVWNYSSGCPLELGGIIENATGMLTSNYAKQTLFSYLGINDVEWDDDFEGHTIAAWGLKLKTRDYAKLGYLYWKNGLWEQNQVLPEYWVDDTRKPALPDALQYGYLFWRAYRYEEHIETQVPLDTYMATGLFQKYIIIIPSYNLILVRLGEDMKEGEEGWDTAEFIYRVIQAVDNQ